MQQTDDEQARDVFSHMVPAECFALMVAALVFPLLTFAGVPAHGAFPVIPMVFLALSLWQASRFSWQPSRWLVLIAINLGLSVWFGWYFWTYEFGLNWR